MNLYIFQHALLDGKRTKPGVFAVEHMPSGKRLIVSTGNLSKRLYDHRRYLARGESHSPELLEDLRRDGADSFRLVVLQSVPERDWLPWVKRRFVSAAREGRGCYNAPDPPTRPTLSRGEPVKGKGGRPASRTESSPSLQEAMRRLAELSDSLTPGAGDSLAWLLRQFDEQAAAEDQLGGRGT